MTDGARRQAHRTPACHGAGRPDVRPRSCVLSRGSDPTCAGTVTSCDGGGITSPSGSGHPAMSAVVCEVKMPGDAPGLVHSGHPAMSALAHTEAGGLGRTITKRSPRHVRVSLSDIFPGTAGTA